MVSIARVGDISSSKDVVLEGTCKAQKNEACTSVGETMMIICTPQHMKIVELTI
jgi:hypothetical protein